MSRFCALISVLLLPSLALAELTGSPSGEAAAAGSDSTLVAEPIIHQVRSTSAFSFWHQLSVFSFLQLSQTYQNTRNVHLSSSRTLAACANVLMCRRWERTGRRGRRYHPYKNSANFWDLSDPLPQVYSTTLLNFIALSGFGLRICGVKCEWLLRTWVTRRAAPSTSTRRSRPTTATAPTSSSPTSGSRPSQSRKPTHSAQGMTSYIFEIWPLQPQILYWLLRNGFCNTWRRELHIWLNDVKYHQ